MPQTLEEFAEAYTKLLVATWSDDSFAQQLNRDPRGTAAEVGLVIPADVGLKVVEPVQTENNSLADYHREFKAGIAAGSVELVIPSAPLTELQDLNSDELADIAGGGACCCCCPCCCSV